MSQDAGQCGGNPLQMTYVMLRMSRWGTWVRWQQSAGAGRDPMPRRVVSCMGNLIEGRMARSGEASAAFKALCPVDVSEAKETHRCVQAMPKWAKQTAAEEYLVRGTQVQKAAALGIRERAYRYRLDTMHVMLLDLFVAAAAGLELEVPADASDAKYLVA